MNEFAEPDWQRLLTVAERDALLADIERVALAVGLSGPVFSAEHGARERASPAERLVLLELLLPTLELAAAQIARNPLTVLVTTMQLVSPPVRARRVAAPALLRAVRGGHADRSVEETMAVVSSDAPENRAMLAFWTDLAHEAAALAGQAEGEDETAIKARDYARRLVRLTRAAWAEGVTRNPSDWTRPVTSRAAARADYAQVFRARDRWRNALRFAPERPSLLVNSRDLWRLYETWCLFQTIDALRALGFAPARASAATPALFAIREGRLLWTLAPGSDWGIFLTSSQGRTVRVSYNQTFAEGRESVSHAMRPDITLSSGQTRWVLDAKFKAYALPGEEGGDINQMHAYRDGIIDSVGTQTVTRAWCLYAGLADAPNRPRLTYSPAPDPPVGALNLRPFAPATFAALCEMLSQWLDTPTAARPASRRT